MSVRDQVKHVTYPKRSAFLSVGEFYAASKTSSANGPHLNVWRFHIYAAEFPQQKTNAEDFPQLVWIAP